MAQPPLLFQEGNTLASRSSFTQEKLCQKTKTLQACLFCQSYEFIFIQNLDHLFDIDRENTIFPHV